MITNSRIARMTILSIFLLMAVEPARAQTTPELQLIAARNNVDGSFLVSEASFADAKHIFLASYEGSLLILQTSKSFPLVATIPVSTLPLRSVRGDGNLIYITCEDGNLYVYAEEAPFASVEAVSYGVPLLSLAVSTASGPKATITVSEFQGVSAADAAHVYLSQLNQGDIAATANKTTYTPEVTFGTTFQSGVTQIFERSGKYLGAIQNPLTYSGSPGQVALFTDGKIMAQTLPGCCGTGVALYDATTPLPEIPQMLSVINEPYADGVATMTANDRRLLVVGTELGTVVLYDITVPTAPVRLSEADLRQLTGHESPDDVIEIRSVTVGPGGLIYAASSWSEDDPSIPAFFVLRVAVK